MGILRVAALILPLTVVGAQASGIDYFTGFVGFGDSYSDKGRIATLPPPSLGGRFSNGPVWYELIGEAFSVRGLESYNLALGGATAGDLNLNDPLYQAYDAVVPTDPTDPDSIPLLQLRNFDAQITSFVNAGFSTMVGSNPLVTILLGGNDFLQDSTRFVNPQSVVDDIVDGIRRIANLDPVGTFDSFLVSNLPDFALSPGSAALSEIERMQLSGAVQAYNATLKANLDLLMITDGLEIEIFDLFETFNGIFADADAMGLNTDVPCTPDIFEAVPLFNNCLTPESADAFLFVDNVHVNAFAQMRIGQAALTQIEPGLPSVPIPASLPLLLAGIGTIAVIRRRASA